MKKKVFTLLTIFLSAFFFCGINFVNADTITLNNFYNHFDNEVSYFLQNQTSYESLIELKLPNTSYALAFRSNTNINVYNINTIVNSTWNWYSTGSNNSLEIRGSSINIPSYYFNKTNPSWANWNSSSGYSSLSFYEGLTYSTYDIIFTSFTANNGHTIESIILPEFTSTALQCTIPSHTISNNQLFPTFIDLYYTYCVAPPDETPLLTSFYSLCIDKIGVVAEEFMTNYIYLAIITIFLFITILLIIKRRLF